MTTKVRVLNPRKLSDVKLAMDLLRKTLTDPRTVERVEAEITAAIFRDKIVEKTDG